MAFSGGTYTLPAGNPVVTGTTIQSSWANTTLTDIATALSTCVLKDGTQTLTANIPMAGFKLTGLGVGSASTDSVTLGQVQNNTISYLTGTAGTNTITATASPTLTLLATGQRFWFIPANTNTAATTLQIDSTAATNVFWNGAALVGGEIRQNVPVEVFYDGTRYQLVASGAMANTYAIPDDGLRIQAAGDRTKMFMVSVTGLPTATTVTMAVPATGATFVGDTLIQTLTNKTLTSPTINTLVTGTAIATQSDMEAATAANLIVSPANQFYHPGMPKAWGTVTTPTTVNASYPSTGVSVVDNGSGNYTITHGRAFSTSSYCVLATPTDISSTVAIPVINAKVTGTFTVQFNKYGGTVGIDFGNVSGIAVVGFNYACYGDL